MTKKVWKTKLCTINFENIKTWRIFRTSKTALVVVTLTELLNSLQLKIDVIFGHWCRHLGGGRHDHFYSPIFYERGLANNCITVLLINDWLANCFIYSIFFSFSLLPRFLAIRGFSPGHVKSIIINFKVKKPSVPWIEPVTTCFSGC